MSTEPTPTDAKTSATRKIASAVVYAAATAFVGGWLITQGWVFVGGAAILFGALALGAVLRPQWLAEALITIFCTSWAGIGLYVLLREGRPFSAIPVLFVFLFGVFKVKGLFRRGRPKKLSASETVIEGKVEDTRTAEKVGIHSE